MDATGAIGALHLVSAGLSVNQLFGSEAIQIPYVLVTGSPPHSSADDRWSYVAVIRLARY